MVLTNISNIIEYVNASVLKVTSTNEFIVNDVLRTVFKYAGLCSQERVPSLVLGFREH